MVLLSKKRPSRGLGVCLLGLGLMSPLAGCSIYDESLLDAAAPSKACQHTTWPAPPSSRNLGGTTNFVVALSALDFGEIHAPPDNPDDVLVERPLGFDLDGKCTKNERTKQPTLNESNGCIPLVPGTLNMGDLLDGRDNAVRHVIAFLALFLRSSGTGLGFFGTSIYNASIQSGDVSLLMEVRDYNGQ